MRVHEALKTGQTSNLVPLIVSVDDVMSISITDPPRRTPEVPDPMVAATLRNFNAALEAARREFDFKDSRITGLRLMNKLIRTTYGDMVKTQPTECIDGINLEVTLARHGTRVIVTIGDLLRINGRWKLDGWFTFREGD